jgi:hypothetical protein
MRKLRNLLTMLILGSLVGLSVAATVQAIRTGLPDPIKDRHEELRRSLTEGHVNELPLEYQRVLLRQLESELRDGVDWKRELESTPPRRRNQAVDNLAELINLWLNEKMDEYYSLPNEYEQEKYLDQEIARVLRWQTTDSLRMSVGPGASEEERAMVMGLVQQLIQHKLPRQGGVVPAFRNMDLALGIELSKKALFFKAVQERWQEIGVRNAFPTGPPPGE